MIEPTVGMDIFTDSHQITRLEIVDTGRRRRWSVGEKLRIVEKSLSAPRLVSVTARRHGIFNQLLFARRVRIRRGPRNSGSGVVKWPYGDRPRQD